MRSLNGDSDLVTVRGTNAGVLHNQRNSSFGRTMTCIRLSLILSGVIVLADSSAISAGEVDIKLTPTFDCISAINDLQSPDADGDNLLRVFLRRYGGAVCEAEIPQEFYKRLQYDTTELGDPSSSPISSSAGAAIEDARKSGALEKVLRQMWTAKEMPCLSHWVNGFNGDGGIDALCDEILAADYFFWPVVESDGIRVSLDHHNVRPSIPFFISISRLLVASALQADVEFTDEQRVRRVLAVKRMSRMLSNGPFEHCSALAGFVDEISHSGIRALAVAGIQPDLLQNFSAESPTPVRSLTDKVRGDHKLAIFHSCQKAAVDFERKMRINSSLPAAAELIESICDKCEQVVNDEVVTRAEVESFLKPLNELFIDAKRNFDPATERKFGAGDPRRAIIRRWAAGRLHISLEPVAISARRLSLQEEREAVTRAVLQQLLIDQRASSDSSIAGSPAILKDEAVVGGQENPLVQVRVEDGLLEVRAVLSDSNLTEEELRAAGLVFDEQLLGATPPNPSAVNIEEE